MLQNMWNRKKVVTYLPVPFFGFIIKLMQHKEVNNIWHIVVPSWNRKKKLLLLPTSIVPHVQYRQSPNTKFQAFSFQAWHNDELTPPPCLEREKRKRGKLLNHKKTSWRTSEFQLLTLWKMTLLSFCLWSDLGMQASSNRV